jgi:hypothetical protein
MASFGGAAAALLAGALVGAAIGLAQGLDNPEASSDDTATAPLAEDAAAPTVKQRPIMHFDFEVTDERPSAVVAWTDPDGKRLAKFDGVFGAVWSQMAV